LSSAIGNAADHSRRQDLGIFDRHLILDGVGGGPRERSVKRRLAVAGVNGGDPGTPRLVIAGFPLKFVVVRVAFPASARLAQIPPDCAIERRTGGGATNFRTASAADNRSQVRRRPPPEWLRC
jgi:hypothetical protein